MMACSFWRLFRKTAKLQDIVQVGFGSVLREDSIGQRARTCQALIFTRLSLLKPYPPDDIESYDASLLVNNPRHDSPECIRPIGG